MLSPNAAKRVTTSFGGGVTVTTNVHELARCLASVAVHVTVVAPTLKLDPLAGAQAVVTGGAPSVTVGAPYVTITGCPVGDGVVTAAGQTMLGGSGVGGGGGPEGFEGLPEHAAHVTSPAHRAARKMLTETTA